MIRQYTYTSKAWQQWKIQSVGNGLVKLVASHTGKVIDVPGASTQNGSQLIQWTYWGGANQHWSINRNPSGYYVITAAHSGKAIDVKGSNTTEGGDIIQSTLSGGTNQQWTISEATCLATGGRTTGDLATLTENEATERIADQFRLWPNPANDHVLIDLRAADAKPVDLS